MNAPPPGGLGGAPLAGGPVGYYTPPVGGGGSRPAVILWYRVYAVVSLLLYLFFVAAFGLFGIGLSTETFLAMAIALPFLIVTGVGVFVPFKPWGWTFGLVVISLGMMSCLAPFSVALIIFWSRPEVKAAFRRL